MYPSLRAFVDALDAAGELARVSARVSPVLEISAIADRASKTAAPRLPSQSARQSDPRLHDRGGPALLFEDVAGSDIPVLINAYGSYRRMEMALGCEAGGFEGIASRIGELVKPQPPRSVGEALAKARQLAPLLRIGPRRGRAAPCQEILHEGDDVDLTRLPLIRCWTHDGDFASLGYPAGINDGVPGLATGAQWDAEYRGRYITLAGIHTIHADDASSSRPSSHNIGMYRVQLLGRRHLAMHWQMHHDGAKHWRSWRRRGERMPVAIAFGGESVLPYAATCPLPPGISELLMAGFLNGRGVRLARAKTVPLWVPANAEIVIEGYVSAGAGSPGWDPRGDEPLGPDAVFEGPFGDHTGFYSLPDRYPLLEVTAITHRAEPVFPATVVGLPLQEDYFLGKATERIMLPLLKTILPDIEDYDLPVFGAFHNAAAIRIEKEYPLHARRVMHGVWGAGQMSWTKTIFVVDGDVDVHDSRAVLSAMAARCDPVRDVEIVRGPTDVLDHATPHLGAGSKLGFDCTSPMPGEDAGGARPREAGVRGFFDADGDRAAEFLASVEQIDGVLESALPDDMPGWLFVRVDRGFDEPDSSGLGARVIDALRVRVSARTPAYTVIVGRDVVLADTDGVLFHWVANFDASRDLHRWEAAGHGFAAFDATPKTAGDERNGEPVRAWPPVLRADASSSARAGEILKSIGVREGSAAGH